MAPLSEQVKADLSDEVELPWITFEITEDTAQEEIDAFLRAKAPSGVSKKDCSWISVHHPVKCAQCQNSDLKALERRIQEMRSNDYMSPKLLDEAARRSGVITGKWMIFKGKDAIDDAWNTVVQLVADPQSRFHSAKVSPCPADTRTQVICAYTKDYLDENDVMAAREELRRRGFVDSLAYKPDVYTTALIYDNFYGFDKIRYRSR